MAEDSEKGVKINLISSRKLDSMTSEEKLRYILDQVKEGTVLVLERGLTAGEEIDLIKSTMSEIDHETFIGIEMQSYSARDLASEGWFARLLGRTRVPKMSVIGPASLLKTIQKNGNVIQAMILTGKTITKSTPGEEHTIEGQVADTETPVSDEATTEPLEAEEAEEIFISESEDFSAVERVEQKVDTSADQSQTPGQEDLSVEHADSITTPTQLVTELGSQDALKSTNIPPELARPVEPSPEATSGVTAPLAETIEREYLPSAHEPEQDQNQSAEQEQAQKQEQQKTQNTTEDQSQHVGFLYKRLKREEE